MMAKSAANSVAQAIRVRREALGLTRKQLSGLAGLGETYISELERGLVLHPRISSLRGIAVALRCSISDLTGESDIGSASDEAVDFPRLHLAFSVAARRLFDQPELTARDLSLLEVAADIYDWLAREEQEGRSPGTVDEILQRIVLVRSRRS